jgi:hypothetical protein
MHFFSPQSKRNYSLEANQKKVHSLKLKNTAMLKTITLPVQHMLDKMNFSLQQTSTAIHVQSVFLDLASRLCIKEQEVGR